MDAHTLELLEFAKIRELVASYAATSLGKERARLLAPFGELAAIHKALALTTEMTEALQSRLDPPLGGLRDVRLPVRKAALGVMLEIDQLRDIQEVLDLTGRAYDYWLRLGNDYPRLSSLLSDIRDLRSVARSIAAAIDDRGRVRDNADPELARIRAGLATFEERIQVEMRRLLRSPEIKRALRYPQATLSGDHHVLPVAVNHRHQVVGVVHRTSSTGETIYIEPAKVAEISAEMAVLKNAEARQIRVVLRRLSTQVGEQAPSILAAIEILAELDLIYAKARYGQDYAMSPPEVTIDGPISLRQARHPYLLHLFRQRQTDPKRPKAPTPPPPGPPPAVSPPSSMQPPASESQGEQPAEVVPITLTLGDTFDLLVITGPNTGGKTVTLKTVGLCCLMALSGLHIPAQAGSQVPLVQKILADIGDEQSLEQSLSTFSSHISRIASILREAGEDTLVLLDELGSGTDPTEGAALGRAILDELVRLRCKGMVTTHLGDLKTYALSAPRAENGAVEFDSVTLRPTYRLMIGQFGQSCALKIARRLKLPRPVVQRAGKYLRRRRSRREPELAKLQQMRQEAVEARDQAALARADAEKAAEDFRRKSDLLQQEAGVSAEIEKARATLKPGDQVRVARFDKAGSVVRVDQRRKIVTVTVGAVEWQLRLDEVIPVRSA